jgi:hypothetical protein
MAKKTKAQRIVEYLERHGYCEVPFRSKKYRAFRKPGKDTYTFVGKAGAVRAGRTVSDSVSVSHLFTPDFMRRYVDAEE